jgi:hypothetical protein
MAELYTDFVPPLPCLGVAGFSCPEGVDIPSLRRTSVSGENCRVVREITRSRASRSRERERVTFAASFCVLCNKSVRDVEGDDLRCLSSEIRGGVVVLHRQTDRQTHGQTRERERGGGGGG